MRIAMGCRPHCRLGGLAALFGVWLASAGACGAASGSGSPAGSSSTSVVQERVSVRVTLTRLHCIKESSYDQGTSADEPYLVVIGFSQPGPYAWHTDVHIFDDVDTGESFNIPQGVGAVIPPRGEASMVLQPGQTVGFTVLIMENDDRSAEPIRRAMDLACDNLRDGILSLPVVDDVTAGLGALNQVLDQVKQDLRDRSLFPDDCVGGKTVVFCLPAPGQTNLPRSDRNTEVIVLSGAGLPEGPPAPTIIVSSGAAVTGPAAAVAAAAPPVPVGTAGPAPVTQFGIEIDGWAEGRYVIEMDLQIDRLPPAAVTAPIVIQSVAALAQARAMRPTGERTLSPARQSLPSSSRRAAEVKEADFLGDYQIYVDGVEGRLTLFRRELKAPAEGPALSAAKTGGLIGGYIEGPGGKRFDIGDFRAEGHSFSFSVRGLPGDPASVVQFRGYLLTQGKRAIAGTVLQAGVAYGFYGVKQKPDNGRGVAPR